MGSCADITLPTSDRQENEIDGLKADRDRLLAENAKLRELVRDIWEGREALPYGLARDAKARMRELGIEVD